MNQDKNEFTVEEQHQLDVILKGVQEQYTELNKFMISVNASFDSFSKTLERINENLDRLNKEHEKREAASAKRTVYSTVLASLLVLLTVLFGYYDVQTYLNIDTVLAVIFSAIAIPFAFFILNFGSDFRGLPEFKGIDIWQEKF